jgi:hypothetical protein
VLFRTSCEVLDVSAFLSRSTAPHLAAFYLAMWRSECCASPFLRDPSPDRDQTKTQIQRLGSGLRAGALQSLCGFFGE